MRIALAVLAAATLSSAAGAAPAPIAGRWVTQEGKALVEIAPCGAQLCGRILRVLRAEPGKAATDIHNPDKALRARPIAGLTILTGFTADGDRWRGRIYDPESGRSYRSELQRAGGTLSVKGCLGPFCRTQSWTAVR